MKQTVLVRKCKSHRIIAGVFLLLTVVFIISSVIYMRDPKVLLICIPLLLPMILLGIYNLTWQLCFDNKYIVKKLFFREVKRYSYAQLQKVVKERYISEQQICVIMHFVDGKTIRFRMDSDGAVQAVKQLSGHRTIIIK